MQIAKSGDTVIIDFVVRTNDGSVVGGTEQEGPQTLKIGGGEVLPQIETALEGMEVGSEKTVIVESDNAFGPRREEMIIEIPRANLPQEPEPEAGMSLAAQQQDGSTLNLVIVEVGEEAVKADGNHPLAGEDLTFGLTLVEIKDAA
ncbi:peptidylprolyl isomerase [Altericroceibacterium spongiae]|uniref:Peptidyl-prolyl cis-trans isomerase n=1 Tax=Altericroceibacterium spongiae TaxID=2320269 RepID=A0A420ER10_9SPHN|nr:FKBP-type peptidyl-prolyl cis-trans isomerase [Altericroceibacterium spongiae]RKF23112.1 peptidylprolyl isomerase [Altericroceibacterium spongiae]